MLKSIFRHFQIDATDQSLQETRINFFLELRRLLKPLSQGQIDPLVLRNLHWLRNKSYLSVLKINSYQFRLIVYKYLANWTSAKDYRF